ncbi:DnaJ-class molecular chaperone with C-terminal Zn finger domain [Halomonas sp. R57-5]|nr:DnaJ-class molecular chaperone with C-terminal Zn finger domain [Halomonas sp. R57-5]
MFFASLWAVQMPEVDVQGRVALRTRTLNLWILKGVKVGQPGQHVRLSEEGSPGPKGGGS